MGAPSRKTIERSCEHCGAIFVVSSHGSHARFCRERCRAAYRYARGTLRRTSDTFSCLASYEDANGNLLTIQGFGFTKQDATDHADEQAVRRLDSPRRLLISTPATILHDLRRSA